MFMALAYSFVGFTVGLVLMLFWLSWEQHQITRNASQPLKLRTATATATAPR